MLKIEKYCDRCGKKIITRYIKPSKTQLYACLYTRTKNRLESRLQHYRIFLCPNCKKQLGLSKLDHKIKKIEREAISAKNLEIKKWEEVKKLIKVSLEEIRQKI